MKFAYFVDSDILVEFLVAVDLFGSWSGITLRTDSIVKNNIEGNDREKVNEEPRLEVVYRNVLPFRDYLLIILDDYCIEIDQDINDKHKIYNPQQCLKPLEALEIVLEGHVEGDEEAAEEEAEGEDDVPENGQEFVVGVEEARGGGVLLIRHQLLP